MNLDLVVLLRELLHVMVLAVAIPCWYVDVVPRWRPFYLVAHSDSEELSVVKIPFLLFFLSYAFEIVRLEYLSVEFAFGDCTDEFEGMQKAILYEPALT